MHNSLLFRIIGRVKDVKVLLLNALFFYFVNMIFIASAVFTTQYLIDYVVPSSSFSYLIAFIIFLLVYELITVISEAYAALLGAYVDKFIDSKLLDEYFKKLVFSPYERIIKLKSGDLLQRVNDAQQIKTYINTILVKWVLNGVVLVFCLIFLLFLQPSAVLFILAGMLVLIGVYVLLAPLVIKREISRFEIKSDLLSIVNFSIKNSEPIRLHHQMDDIYKRKINLLNLYTSKEEVINKYNILARFLTVLIKSLTVLLIKFYVVYAIFNQSGLSIGQMVSVFLIADRIFLCLVQIMMSGLEVRRSGVAVDRFLVFSEAIDLAEDDNYRNPMMDSTTAINSVSIESVSGSALHIDSLFKSVTLVQGDVLKISGGNGCGKTTLCRCIANLIDVPGISVSFNKETQILKNIKIAKKISMTGIYDSIFPGTIMDNIMMGRMANEMDVLLMSQKIGFDNVINSRDGGFNYTLSIEHPCLSEGEMRKLLFLRIIFSDADVLIFDEAFRGIDAKSLLEMEQIIMDLKNKIVIYVTHQEHKFIKPTKEILLDKRIASKHE